MRLLLATIFLLFSGTISASDAVDEYAKRVAKEPGVLTVINKLNLKHPIFSPATNDHGIDRTAFLRTLVREVTRGQTTDKGRALTWMTWLQRRIAHPKFAPMHDKATMIVDPHWIIKNRLAQCGQTNRTLVDGLLAIGQRARIVQLTHHVAAEAWWNGSWHYLDADWLHDGEAVRRPDGTIPSAQEIADNTKLLDAIKPVSEFKSYPVDISNRPELFGDPVGLYKKGFDGSKVGGRRTPYYLEKTATPDELNDSRYGWHRYRVVPNQGPAAKTH